MIAIIDPTTSGSFAEKVEEIVHIKAIQNTRENLALADSVAETENRGKEAIPSDISKLELVDDDKEPDEDLRKIGFQKLKKKQRMSYKVESLGHVSLTSEYFRPIPQEISYSFHYRPCTHRCWCTFLVGKLKIIQKKFFSKEFDDDPIKYLQDKTTNSNRPIIFTWTYAAHFIFDDGNESSQQKKDRNIAMNEEAFEDVSEERE